MSIALAALGGLAVGWAQQRLLARHPYRANRSGAGWAGPPAGSVPLFVAALAGILAWRHPGIQVVIPLLMLLAAVPLAWIDHDTHLLPNAILLPWLLLTLTAAAACSWAGIHPGAWPRALFGAAAALGLYLLQQALLRGRMGAGDIKLGICLGAALGAMSPLAWVVGVNAGWLLLLPFNRSRPPEQRDQPLPYGPPLLLGGILGMVL